MFGESASEMIEEEPSVVTEVEGRQWTEGWDESDEERIFRLPPPRPKGTRLVVKGYPETAEGAPPEEWSKVFEKIAKEKEEKKVLEEKAWTDEKVMCVACGIREKEKECGLCPNPSCGICARETWGVCPPRDARGIDYVNPPLPAAVTSVSSNWHQESSRSSGS